MSTNFYAHWKVSDDPEVVVKLHIGKRVRQGLSTVSGRHFPTCQAWADFLRHNITFVTVYDEYGTQHDTEQFITDELFSGDINTELWEADAINPVPWKRNRSLSGDEWVDVETNKRFYNGIFC